MIMANGTKTQHGQVEIWTEYCRKKVYTDIYKWKFIAGSGYLDDSMVRCRFDDKTNELIFEYLM